MKNAAITGVVLGAAAGLEAIPQRRVAEVLGCRPLAAAGFKHVRPMDHWPDDLLEIAEALLRLA